MNESMILKNIMKNPKYISEIENPTEEMCLEAVKQDGFVLQYIKKQTPSICLEAVKQGTDLRYVIEQTPEICLEAVKQSGMDLRYVIEQTPEICLEAVRQEGSALQFVREQNTKICLEAVRQRGLALKYVKEQTQEICLAAVKDDGFALQFVKEQSPEICLEAVKQNYRSKKYVRDLNMLGGDKVLSKNQVSLLNNTLNDIRETLVGLGKLGTAQIFEESGVIYLICSDIVLVYSNGRLTSDNGFSVPRQFKKVFKRTIELLIIRVPYPIKKITFEVGTFDLTDGVMNRSLNEQGSVEIVLK